MPFHHEGIVLFLGGVGFFGGDGVLELAVDRIILDLIREIIRIGGNIHHRNNINGLAQKTLIAKRLEHQASDAAETVDRNTNLGHGKNTPHAKINTGTKTSGARNFPAYTCPYGKVAVLDGTEEARRWQGESRGGARPIRELEHPARTFIGSPGRASGVPSSSGKRPGRGRRSGSAIGARSGRRNTATGGNNRLKKAARNGENGCQHQRPFATRGNAVHLSRKKSPAKKPLAQGAAPPVPQTAAPADDPELVSAPQRRIQIQRRKRTRGTTEHRGIESLESRRLMSADLFGESISLPRFGNAASGPADHLVLVVQPATTPVGKIFSVAVAVEDSLGNIVATDTSAVTLSITAGPRTGSLGGVTSAAVKNGEANFNGLFLSQAGTYTLQASDPLLANPAPISFQQIAPAGITTISAPPLAERQFSAAPSRFWRACTQPPAAACPSPEPQRCSAPPTPSQ